MLRIAPNISLKITAFMLSIVVFGLILVNPCYCAKQESGLINIKPNEKLPSFVLPDFTTHKPVTFKTSSGKPSIISFFSLSPVFRQKRSLNILDIQYKIQNKYQDRINSVAIFSDDKKIPLLKQFINDGLISVDVLNDKRSTVYNKYGVFMMPIIILLNSDGSLHAVIPYTGELEELLLNNIKYLLGDITQKDLQNSLKTPPNILKSKEEKEYIRRVNYGRVMLARKMFPAALREFTTATKILPNSIESFIGLGNTYLKTKKFVKAESSFEKALKINKDSDEALAGLGISLYRQGRAKEALPILENAIITQTPTLDVIITLADIYEQNGQIKKAMRLNKLAVSNLKQKFD